MIFHYCIYIYFLLYFSFSSRILLFPKLCIYHSVILYILFSYHIKENSNFLLTKNSRASSSGTSGCWTSTHTIASRLQRSDAVGEREQRAYSSRLRGAVDARKTFTQFHGTGAPGTRRYRSNRTTSEKSTIRMPFRSEIARITENAAITFCLQVKIAIA